MKILAPVLQRESYTRALEAELVGYVEDVLLKPLRDVRLNAVESDALLAAIAAGRVWHDGQRWRGQFNIEISKRIRAAGGFEAPYGSLPEELREALREASAKFSSYKAALLGTLSAIEGNVQTLPEAFDPAPVKAIVADAATQFEESVKGVSDAPVPVGGTEQAAEEAIQSLTGYRTGLVLTGIGLLRDELAKARSPADLEDRVGLVSSGLKRRAALGADQAASKLVATVAAVLSLQAGFGVPVGNRRGREGPPRPQGVERSDFQV